MWDVYQKAKEDHDWVARRQAHIQEVLQELQEKSKGRR